MPVALPERFVKKNHFAAIHPHFYLPSKVTQRIWTVDNPRIAKRYFRLDVAGIFTNNFELMNKVKEKSRYNVIIIVIRIMIIYSRKIGQLK